MNIRKYLALMSLLAAASAQSFTINIDNKDDPRGIVTIAHKVAPQYFFHAYEQTFPISIETLLSHSKIKWQHNNQITEHPSFAHLTGELGPDVKDRHDNDHIIIGSEALSHRPTGERNLIHDTPIYLTVRESQKRLYLIYSMLMPLSDCQIFRTKIYQKFHHSQAGKRRNFEWCNAAKHYGDWETTTVVVDNQDQPGKVLGIVTVAHGKEIFTPFEKVDASNGNGGWHPRIAVSLNTHGLYPKGSAKLHYTSKASDLKPLVGLYNTYAVTQPNWKIDWLQTIDLTSSENLGQLVKFSQPVYRNRQDKPEGLIWNSWQSHRGNGVEALEGRNLENWQGRWGQTKKLATNMGQPSGNVPNVDDAILRRAAKDAAKLLGGVNWFAKLFSGDTAVDVPKFNSPNSPWDSGWAKKDPFGNVYALAEDKYYADKGESIKTINLTIEGYSLDQRRINLKQFKAIGQKNLHRWTVPVALIDSAYKGKHKPLQLNGRYWNTQRKKPEGSQLKNTSVKLQHDDSYVFSNPLGEISWQHTEAGRYLVYQATGMDKSWNNRQDVIYLPITKRDGKRVTYRIFVQFKL